MYFSEIVDEALRGWMIHDTWNSGHPLDQARFYIFARKLATLYLETKEYTRDIGDVTAKLKQALRQFHPSLTGARFATEVERYAERAEVIMAYEKAPSLLRM